MLDALRAQGDVDAASDDLFGPVKRRAGRKLNHADEVALVLLGDEAGRRPCKLDARNADEPHIDHEHHSARAHEAASQASVTEGEPLEAAIEAIEGAVEQAARRPDLRTVARYMRLEEHGAEGWAQRQRDEAGDDGRGRDRHGELTEEQPRDAGDEGGWYKHGAERQRNRDQRTADLVHRVMRRLCGGHSGADVAFDVLDDD